MRKIYFSMLVLTMMLVSAVAKAQADYTATFDVQWTNDWVAAEQYFSAEEVAGKLGITAAELQTLLNPEQKDTNKPLAIMAGTNKVQGEYSADPIGWWISADGATLGWGETATWFIAMEYAAAADDEELTEDKVGVIVGQMPDVYKYVYEPTSLSTTIYFIAGEKEVSFAVTENIEAAVKANVPDPVKELSKLTIVKDYELNLELVQGKFYEGKSFSATLDGLYDALGVAAADLDPSASDYVFAQLVASETTGEGDAAVTTYSLSDNLETPDNASGGAWFGSYVNIDEATDTETPLPISCPMNYGAGKNTFYLQEISLAEGVLTIGSAGQYPDVMTVGNDNYTYLYIIAGEKAARVKVTAVISEPEVIDPDAMVKVEEELELNVQQDPLSSGYAALEYVFDVAKVAELLECEAADIDSWKVWASEGGAMIDYSDTNDGYIGGDGYPMTWDDGAFVYIQPVKVSEGKFKIGQRGGHETIMAATAENPLIIPVQLLFVHGQKYVVLNINLTIAPDEGGVPDPDTNFDEIVATVPINMNLLKTGKYYGENDADTQKLLQYDLGIETIQGLLGEGNYTVYGLQPPAAAGENSKIIGGGSYGVDAYTDGSSYYDAGIWMAEPVEALGEEYAHTSYAGTWGANSYGIEWKLSDGIFAFAENPDTNRQVGDYYTSIFYWVNTDTKKAIKLAVTVTYVEEATPSTKVEVVDVLSGTKELPEDGILNLPVTNITEALGITVDELEGATVGVALNDFVYSTIGGVDSKVIDANGYDVSENPEKGVAAIQIDFDEWTLTYDPIDYESFESGKVVLAFDYDGKRVICNLTLGTAEYIATAINGVNAAKTAKAGTYNLAGQRVNESYKGIVIRNGKKVLVK